MALIKGTLVKITQEYVVFESEQRSACQGCKLKSGCAQNLLSKGGKELNKVIVPYLEKFSTARVGDVAELDIPDYTLAVSAVVAYLVPAVAMVFGVLMASLVSSSDLAALIGMMFGLVIGAFCLALFGHRNKNNVSYQPRLSVGSLSLSDKPGERNEKD